MKIKTFQAMTMQEALNAIKAELGPDAVILSTKSLAPGKTRFGLLGRPMVEVTAAIDRHAKPSSMTPRPAAPAGGSGGTAPVRFTDVLRTSLEHTRTPQPAAVPAAPPVGDRTLEPVLEELKSLREAIRASGLPVPRATDQAHGLKGGLPSGSDRLADGGVLTPEWAACADVLLRSGLDRTTVNLLLTEARGTCPTTTVSPSAIPSRQMRQALLQRVRVSGPLLEAGERKKTVILIGPTGVGKTTTLAKLAAHYKLTERRRVAFLTLDTYRLAAVEQLRTYANLIGVPMDVALTRRDAIDCIDRRREIELLLVDTAGRSPRDAVGMAELRQLLDLGHPVEVHLVLAATTRDRDLLDYIAHYQTLPISRLLFTKLDETASGGAIFEVMHRTGLPLSYLTRGQRVPEDLELATPETVTTLIAGAASSDVERHPLLKTV